MNVSSTAERSRLTTNLRERGFEGKVFETTRKGKTIYTRQAKNFVRQQIIVGRPAEATGFAPKNFVPKGMVYDIEKNTFLQDKEVLKKKGKIAKLQKRFAKLGMKFEKRQRAIVPGPDVNARLSGTINAVARRRYTRRDGTVETIEFNLPPTMRTTRFQTSGTWKDTLLDNWEEELRERYDIEIISATTDDMDYFPKQGARGVSLDNVRLRQALLIIDGMEQQGWDTKSNKCVIDFLRWYYADDKRLCKEYLTDETFNFCFEDNYMIEGVSTIELRNWCEMTQTKMIALDSDYRVIKTFKPKHPSGCKILIYIIKNQHIHPIIDPLQIKSVSNTLASNENEIVKGKSKKIKEIIANEKKEEAKLPVKIITDDMRGKSNNLQHLCKMMVKEKIDVLGRKITWGKGGPQTFIMKGKKYIFHHAVDDDVKNFIELNGEKFTGQKASGFVYDAMDKFGIRFSKCNDKINQLFSEEHSKHKTHEGGRINDEAYIDYWDHDGFDWSVFQGAQAFDINKCHTHILQNPMEEWYMFDFKDGVEKFIPPVEDQPLLPGMYYVETKDRKLFMGNKFYSKVMVCVGLGEGLITLDNIKYAVYCSEVLPKDYFSGLFDTYSEMTEGKELGKEMKKLLNNTTTGILGKTQYNITEKWITNDCNEATKYLIENNDKDWFQYKVSVDIDDDGERIENFWCYGQKHKVLKQNNNFAMYNQVLDNQAIMLYSYIKSITKNEWNRLLHRKTDCFTCIPHPEVDLSEFMGTDTGMLKTELLPNKPKNTKYTDMHIDWSYYISDWKIFEDIKSSYDYEKYYDLIESKTSLCTTGEAGCGKSHIIKKIQEKYPNVLTIAFTNVASLRVSGGTIHKTFKFDNETGTISKATIKMIEKENPPAVIIDEKQIIHGDLWRILYEVKKRLRIPFYLFGDWKQLNNFDNYEYKDHDIIKSICDYNITQELEYHDKCRMSTELRSLISPFRGSRSYSVRNILPSFKEIRDVSQLPMTNICYSNIVKNQINREMNAHHYLSSKYLDIPRDIYDVVDAYFPSAFDKPSKENPKPKRPFEFYRPHVGMPIICIKNSHVEAEEKNGQRYVITDIFAGSKIEYDNQKPKEEYLRIFGKEAYSENTARQELIKECYSTDKIKIKCLNSKKEYDISLLHLIVNFDMAYAMTNHKIVGDTLTDFCIHQLDFPRVENKWLYTAFSRGTETSDVKWCKKY